MKLRLRIKLKFTPEQLYDGHEMPLTRKTFFQRGGGVLQTQEAPPQKPMNSPGSGTPGPASPNGPGAVFMPPLSPLMKNSQVKQRTEGLNYVFYKVLRPSPIHLVDVVLHWLLTLTLTVTAFAVQHVEHQEEINLLYRDGCH